MSRFASADGILFALSIVGYATLLVRLWISGLERTYRIFSLYLAFQLVRSLAMFFLPRRTNLYATTFFLTEAVIWVLYVLVVFELHHLVIHKYRGISTVGRRLLTGGLAVAMVVSLASLAPDISAGPGKYPILQYFMVTERGIVSMLLFFLLLLGCFVAWFPIPLPRNVITHTMLFAVYFLSKNMGLFLWNMAGAGTLKLASTAFQAVACACLAWWVLALDRAGERTQRVLLHRWSRQDEDRLLGQLEALNATLGGRKEK